ncbi:M48 family metalloprotease [Streptosporangium saharense]|uniref:M48 family metalloprotease n=1 Tax=Streptosporangium saharense TaxID=1706840 RepID=UPI00332C4160
MSRVTAAEPDLLGLAELTQTLHQAAGDGSVLVVIDPDLADGARTYGDLCSGVHRIDLGADLLADRARLYGALTHEIAHHALGHLTARRPWLRVCQAAAVAAVVFLLTGYPWPATAAVALAVAAYLVDARQQRREELAADAHSVALLNAAGLPGHTIVAATLAAGPADPWWHRAGGWIGGSHPTMRSRQAAVSGR